MNNTKRAQCATPNALRAHVHAQAHSRSCARKHTHTRTLTYTYIGIGPEGKKLTKYVDCTREGEKSFKRECIVLGARIIYYDNISYTPHLPWRTRIHTRIHPRIHTHIHSPTQAFGPEGKRLTKYVDCTREGEKGFKPECIALGIRVVPTWGTGDGKLRARTHLTTLSHTLTHISTCLLTHPHAHARNQTTPRHSPAHPFPYRRLALRARSLSCTWTARGKGRWGSSPSASLWAFGSCRREDRRREAAGTHTLNHIAILTHISIHPHARTHTQPHPHTYPPTHPHTGVRP